MSGRRLLLVLLLGHLAATQAAPCDAAECRDAQDEEEVRSHCSYPCECPPETPTCPSGVSLIRDGCGCCSVCARQLHESCDGTALCDEHRGLVCQYPAATARTGRCQVIKGLPCNVANKTFDNGETFLLDCRTQCSCQNGTYACSSLCPQEAISPNCSRPRLVDVPDQCCREWLCDSVEAEQPPSCAPESSAWAECSADNCGLGVSSRLASGDPRCEPFEEHRLCQIRPCLTTPVTHDHAAHKIRRGHECKATLQAREPVRLRVGGCVSRRLYWPRWCGACAGGCCAPQFSTTRHVEFECPDDDLDERRLLRLAETPTAPASQLWEHRKSKRRRRRAPPFGAAPVTRLRVGVQWILKCACAPGPCPERLHRVHRTAVP